jgi:hypothetical protein
MLCTLGLFSFLFFFWWYWDSELRDLQLLGYALSPFCFIFQIGFCIYAQACLDHAPCLAGMRGVFLLVEMGSLELVASAGLELLSS